MDTLVTEVNGRLILTNQARIVRATEDVSVDLAAATNYDIEKSNPFIKWIVGDFVEADNPNRNTQFWTKDDLALGEYSIKYSPLNMLHKQTVPVGFFLSTRTIDLNDKASIDEALDRPKKGKHRFIHPSAVNSSVDLYGPQLCVACGMVEGNDCHDDPGSSPAAAPAVAGSVSDAAAAAHGSAKIEALAGMWSHVFPFEAALVDQADEMGSLFYSMECRGSHVHCAGPDGCDQSFEYMATDTHCQHLKERSSVRHIVNPTFRGGALIIPPTRPGWKDASASVYQDSAVREMAEKYAEMSESSFNQINEAGSELSPSQWESLMGQIVAYGRPIR